MLKVFEENNYSEMLYSEENKDWILYWGEFMEKQIVCVGNMTHDILLRVEDLPKIDDVGYVYDNTKCMGGRGAIVALTLSSLGCNCSYFTSIPNNPNAKNISNFYKTMV